MDAAFTALPLSPAPVVAPADPVGCSLPDTTILFSRPLMTVRYDLKLASGCSCGLRSQAVPDPVFAGFQRPGSEPLPKNHVTNSGEIGVADCAYAVPLSFNMMSSNGNGIDTLAPVASMPRRTVRRSSGFIFMGDRAIRVAVRRR